MSFWKRLSAGLAASASIGLLAGSAIAQGLPTCKDSDKIVQSYSAGGREGEGNDEWNESDYVRYGPITQVEVWAGRYVDAIRVKYGNIFGQKHGGGGGDYQHFDLQPGEFITQISGKADRYVDRICFQTNQRPSLTCMGGDGGNDFQTQQPDARVVAFGGRAGDFDNKLIFIYGRPWRAIDGSFQYDSGALANAVSNTPGEQATQTFTNRSGVTQTYTYSKQLSETDISKVEWRDESNNIWKAGIELTLGHKAGAAGGTEGGVKLSFEYTRSELHSRAGSTENQRNKTQAWTYPVTVPPHSQVTATATWYNVPLNLDVKYTAVYYDGVANENERDACQEARSTRFQGVASTSVNVTLEQSPLN